MNLQDYARCVIAEELEKDASIFATTPLKQLAKTPLGEMSLDSAIKAIKGSAKGTYKLFGTALKGDRAAKAQSVLSSAQKAIGERAKTLGKVHVGRAQITKLGLALAVKHYGPKARKLAPPKSPILRAILVTIRAFVLWR